MASRSRCRRTLTVQGPCLGVGEDATAGQEAQALGYLEREAGTAAWDDINDELGMRPKLELSGAHVERAAGDLAEQDILRARPELAGRIAHGRTAVAAAARLVEQELAVALAQPCDQSDSGGGGSHALDHEDFQPAAKEIGCRHTTGTRVGIVSGRL